MLAGPGLAQGFPSKPQGFPSKPMRILVPGPAGSSPDIRARQIGGKLSEALGQPVLVDVRIDYSKRTRFTEGVIRTNLKRFGIADQARLVGRALWRRVTG